MQAVAIESKRTIDIDELVPKDEIDELYLNKPYYIAPDGEVGQQAFAVIREAIRKEGMVAPHVHADHPPCADHSQTERAHGRLVWQPVSTERSVARRRRRAASANALHQPFGLISPSTTLHDFCGSNSVQVAHMRMSFGLSWYSASFCDIFSRAPTRHRTGRKPSRHARKRSSE